MGFFSGLFGNDGDNVKLEKFRELSRVFSSDEEMLAHSKATWLTSRGNHYGQEGKLDAAMADFVEAISLKKDHLPAYLSLAVALNANGETDKARRVIEDAPEEVKLHGKVTGTKTQAMKDAMGGAATIITEELNNQRMENWKEFQGKKNTPEVLKAKARALSVVLQKTSVDCAEAFIKRMGKPLAKEDFVNIVTEFEMLFLHLADRVTFNTLGADGRDRFTDALWHLNITSKSFNTTADLFNERNRLYGALEEVTPKKTFLDGNVYGEFTKKIAARLSINPGDRMEMMMALFASAEIINHGAEEMDIKTLVSEQV